MEYNEVGGQCNGTNLPPLTTSMPAYSTVLSVMEAGVSQGSSYQFEVQYSSIYDGCVVEMLDGTRNQDPCSWTLYMAAPGNPEKRANSAMDNYNVANNYTIILRYEMQTATYSTRYSIEYPDSFCTNMTSIPAISVVAPKGSSALQIMGRAACIDRNRYHFSTSYDSVSSGYVVVEIDGNKRTSACTWVAFTVSSGNNEMQLPGSVADFVIPADNFQLILRFIKKVLPRTPVPVITTTSIPVMATTDGNQAREFYIACVQECIFVCIHLCMYIRLLHVYNVSMCK